MKKILLFSALLCTYGIGQAQETFLNNQLLNSGGELYGTARYVGMGGAMGALGADMSCMSFNPAGIGLYRRNDIGFTAGAIWNTNKVELLKNARGTLDQMGIVYSAHTDNDKLQFLNLGFNYQKKLNFGGAFAADNANLNGLSQMDQLAEMVNGDMGTEYNIPGAASYYGFLTPVDANGDEVLDVKNDADKIAGYVNAFNGERNMYTHNQWGGVHTFDLNVSGNVNDRFYFGLTAGIESMKYRSETWYYEESSVGSATRDYEVNNMLDIDGWGFNLKMGLIVRPIEDNPLRVGLAFETPTWYSLRSNSLTRYTYYDYDSNGKQYPIVLNPDLDESGMDYSLHNPVKGRLSIGSTVGNYLAWDIDYEWANYGKNFMGYPRSYDYDGSARLFDNEPDRDMNKLTKSTLGFQHTVRAGVEVKPTSNLAFRIGYNFASSPYKDNVGLDQYSLDSYARDYLTYTNFMKVGNAHTMTLGFGYKYKKFYVDLAYKVRSQKADFYAFDSSFTGPGGQFSLDFPELEGAKLTPVQADLSRQQLTATLGFKF